MKKLFLDDIRMPVDAGRYMDSSLIRLYNDTDWIIVRNYDEFVRYIMKSGMPDLISFDHDLGEDEAIELHSSGLSKRASRRHKKTVKSGMDCAKWLVDYCMDYKIPMCEFLVHSANPPGAENIRSLLTHYSRVTK